MFSFVVMQWGVSDEFANAAVELPLLFFDFQLPWDVLHMRPEAHGSDKLLILIWRTRRSVWFSHQTRRLKVQHWATVKPGSNLGPPAVRDTSQRLSGWEPLSHFPSSNPVGEKKHGKKNTMEVYFVANVTLHHTVRDRSFRFGLHLARV